MEAGERAPMASTRLFSGLPPKRLRARHFLYSSFAGEAFTSCSRPVLKDDSTSKELMSMDMEPRNGMKRSCGGGEGTRRVRGVAAGSGGVVGTSAGFPTTGLEDRGTYRRRRVFSGVCASVGVSDINGCPDIAASATREAVPGSRLGVLDGALVLRERAFRPRGGRPWRLHKAVATKSNVQQSCPALLRCLRLDVALSAGAKTASPAACLPLGTMEGQDAAGSAGAPLYAFNIEVRAHPSYCDRTLHRFPR